MDERGTRAFRAGLRDALPRWRAEGLVDEAAAARLAARHDLDDAALDGLGLLPVYVLAALLVGSGVVSLVAWHWDELARTAKVALVLGMVAGAHLGGAALRRSGRHAWLAEGVTLLGSLLFGAGIALMAQIFNVTGAWYGIFGAFAVGALAAGLLLDSGSTLVAASAAGLGVWSSGWLAARPGDHGLVVPYALALGFGALGWRRRSPALLAVTALGLALASLVSAGVVLWALPPLLVGAALLAVPLSAGPAEAPLAGVLAWTGRLAFAAVAFAISFLEAARHVSGAPRLGNFWPARGAESVGVAGALAAGAVALGLARWRGGRLDLAEALVAASACAVVGLGVGLEEPMLTAVAANAALAGLAALLVARGLATGQRGSFWSGVALGDLLLVARFLEIERLLWLKGLGFIAAGALIAWGVVTFERRRKEVRHAA